MNIPDLIFEKIVPYQFLGGKIYFNSVMRIRDLVNPGSGMEKIGPGIKIPDPQHCDFK
jgi:hypothetical protein